jgi:Spy/CpxP family protein refolding chaperone
MKPTAFAAPLTLLALLLSAMAAAASQSQGANPPKWWQSDLYKRELGLKPEQSSKLEEIFQNAVPKQKALKQALDEAEALFEQLAAKRAKKEAAEQLNRVISARAELMKSHGLMLLEMRLELTPEQWTKLGEMQKQQQQQSGAKPRTLDKGK